MGYSKEFLICAFLWRYYSVLVKYTNEQLDSFVEMTERFYDEVGKDKFRVYASLDADVIKQYSNRNIGLN